MLQSLAARASLLFLVILPCNSFHSISPNGQRGPDASEQAVILYLKVSNRAFGSGEEASLIHSFEDKLEQTIKEKGLGEFDGDEFGEGYATLYMYSADARALYQGIAGAIEGFRPHPGSYVILRYGPPGARQEKKRLPATRGPKPSQAARHRIVRDQSRVRRAGYAIRGLPMTVPVKFA